MQNSAEMPVSIDSLKAHLYEIQTQLVTRIVKEKDSNPEWVKMARELATRIPQAVKDKDLTAETAQVLVIRASSLLAE